VKGERMDYEKLKYWIAEIMKAISAIMGWELGNWIMKHLSISWK
jgi:hypothetical protein